MLNKKCPNTEEDKTNKETGPSSKKYEGPSSSEETKAKYKSKNSKIKKPNPEIIRKKTESIFSLKTEVTQIKLKDRNNPNVNTPKSEKDKKESHPSAKSEKKTKNKTTNKLGYIRLKNKKKVICSISGKNEKMEEESNDEK